MMDKDFTRKKYRELIKAFMAAGYQFQTLEEYVEHPLEGKVVVLRHDVDLHPYNSLFVGQLEHSLGVRSSFYFRVGAHSNRPDVIKSLVALDHEIGYHYEDMALMDGDVEEAYDHFKGALNYFRTMYPVRTICMHGAPTSRYDGRDLWKHYSYRDLGIICEPYLDIDFSKMLYLTDTGRRWDGYKVSLRDKIPVYQDQWKKQGLTFHATNDIIAALRDPASKLNTLAPRIMVTTHPQRWNDEPNWWRKELIEQTIKNFVKRILVIFRR